MRDDGYVAVFCPNCGIHLNEVEEQDCDPVSEPRPVSFGESYTCGWCGVRTVDWSHVARCRRTAGARRVLQERAEAARLASTVSNLLAMVKQLETEE